MKNALLIVSFFVFSATVARAQQWPFELWHEGKIILVSGDTLRGQVKYDLQQDLVQLVFGENKTEAFTPRKVLYFEIFDKTVNRYRKFFTLPYNATAGYRTSIFFELVEEGKMTLLAREAVEFRTYNSPYYFGSYSRQVLVYKYYFLEEDGDIVEFTGNRNDLLAMMGKESEEVEKYMRTNRLKFDEKYDLARIIAYYNSLAGS